MTTHTTLNRTPLFEEHTKLQAKMVPFGGWEMPVQYDGILSEYGYTRNGAALFDISHMGEFLIYGNPVENGLDRIVTQSIVNMPIKSCRYGAMLNEGGSVVDDLIVFRIEEEKWFLVVNGATTEKDEKHIQNHIAESTRFENVSFKTGKLDIQGPKSREILKRYVEGIEKLDYYTFDYFDLLKEKVLISRTGYTGELGYEIYYPWDKTIELWIELLSNDDLKPAGLGARDILRLEVGYSLYGHELDEQTLAVESGLKRFIDLDKEFIGKKNIVSAIENGSKQKLIGLISQSRRSPRAEQSIFSADGAVIGRVTSGAFSPQLEKGIGLGFIDYMDIKIGDKIKFGNEKVQEFAEVSSKNFYKGGSLKQ